MWKVIAVTAMNEMVCIEIVDRGFVRNSVFPKVNSFVLFDNLSYAESVVVSHNDLSFQQFDRPPAAGSDHLLNSFVYHHLRFSLKS